MIEVDLLDMLESTVILTQPVHLARDGSRVGGTPVSIRAHIEPSAVRVKNQAGQEVDVNGQAMLDDVYPWVTEDTHLVLPVTGDQIISAVETTYGPNLDTGTSGPYQTIIYF